MKHSLDAHLTTITQEQQKLCEHFTEIVKEESPKELLSQFQSFWVDGKDYPNKQVEILRDNLLPYKVEQEAFNICLYKSCQSLIEGWQTNPESEMLIPKLVHLVTRPTDSNANIWQSRTALRLSQRLEAFRKSDEAESLENFLALLQPTPIASDRLETQPLKSFLYRYPYLYPYSLMSENSGQLSHSLRRLKSKNTHEFDTNLSQYVINQVRRHRANQLITKNNQRISYTNPTFLSDKELNRALQEYLGKVNDRLTNNELAQTFTNYQVKLQYYGDYKKVLYQYLTRKLTSNYCQRQLNPLLEKHLASILPQKSDRPITDFLTLRTCTELLHLLVVESKPPHKHVTFLNLISNFGAIRTTSLLMRILLICPQVRSQLERQFWVLFKHYADSPCTQVKGLIKIWENYNVALACYFGKADLSWALQIPPSK